MLCTSLIVVQFSMTERSVSDRFAVSFATALILYHSVSALSTPFSKVFQTFSWSPQLPAWLLRFLTACILYHFPSLLSIVSYSKTRHLHQAHCDFFKQNDEEASMPSHRCLFLKPYEFNPVNSYTAFEMLL